MSTTTTVEREIKLRFDSAESARAAMLAAGATPLPGPPPAGGRAARHRGRVAARRRCVLRVRLENGKSRITFKGPVQPSAMKLRDEFETIVGDGVLLLRIFEELGFHVWFRYEKYREEFSHEDVIVAIDETPVGVFVEIEGSEQRHHRRWRARSAAARRLRPRFVPRAVPEAPRGVRPDRHRHGVRSRRE